MSAGFSDEDLEEGWSLLRTTSPGSLGTAPTAAGTARDAFGKLEAWAKRYVRLVETAVKNRHPASHAALYDALPATTGGSVSVGVSVFLDRVDALRGDEGKAVRALLEKRGLTSEVIAEARALVVAAQQLAPVVPSFDYEGAEEAAWRWYLEWTAIARQTIDDGRVLRRLGFGSESD